MKYLPTPMAVLERLEPRALFASTTVDVTIGTGAAATLRFSDGDGTAATISMTGGAAVVHLAGEQLAQAAAGREIVVTGTNISVSGITANTSRRSALTISASGGDRQITLGGVSTTGPMKRLLAPQAVLAGAVSIGGPVAQFDVLGADSALITIGAGAGAGGSSINIRGAAANTTLTSAAPLRKVTLNTWSTTSGAGGGLTAPSVGKLFTAGNFEGAFSTASAKSLDFSGLLDATINVTGDVGLLRAREGASGSVVNVGRSIRTAFFNVLQRTHVYCGVRTLAPGSPPTTASDFVDGTSVRRFTVGNADSTFDSVVAARVIDKLWMGGIRKVIPGGFNPNTIVVTKRVRDFRGTLYDMESQQPFHYKNVAHEDRQLGVVLIHVL